MSTKSERTGQCLEEPDVAAGATAEPVIEPDDDLPRLEPADQDVLHERLRLDRGDGRRERDHHGRVDPGLRDQLQPFLERRDRKRRTVGLEDFHRVPVERAGERTQPAPLRQGHGCPQDGAMAKVNAVEGAERDGARPRVRREGFESADDLHAGCGRV